MAEANLDGSAFSQPLPKMRIRCGTGERGFRRHGAAIMVPVPPHGNAQHLADQGTRGLG
jgi:hypothetical protein